MQRHYNHEIYRDNHVDESSYLRGVLRKVWLGLDDLNDLVRFDRDDLHD